MITQARAAPVRSRKGALSRRLYRYRYLYLMLALPMAHCLLFRYAPMYGIQVAFKDYNLFQGIQASDWAGLDIFREVFQTRGFYLALRNTLVLNTLDLVVGFPVPILLAILLNEMTSVRLRRVSQTLLYLPHFLSWIIIGGMVYQIFSTSGFVNVLIARLTGDTVPFLSEKLHWVILYVLTGIWQSAGWGTIIYLAAISGISPALYESAAVDGCGIWKRIWYITLPCIRSTIVVMLILQLGRMVSIGFERPFVMGNAMVSEVSDVISTFVYRMGLKTARYSLAAAVGLFGSVVNMIFVLSANSISRRIGEDGLW